MAAFKAGNKHGGAPATSVAMPKRAVALMAQHGQEMVGVEARLNKAPGRAARTNRRGKAAPNECTEGTRGTARTSNSRVHSWGKVRTSPTTENVTCVHPTPLTVTLRLLG